jgi:sugar phosphate isomerase/epimerase
MTEGEKRNGGTRCGARVPRRTCLKTIAAAWIGTQAPALLAGEAKVNKKNIRLGIDAGVYAKLPVEEAASRIKADGFCNVLCSYRFADVQFDASKPDWKAAEKIAGCFERHGVRIAAVFGYVNVIDPDPARRKAGEARLHALLKNWKRLGCNNVSTETGTFNEKSQWLDSPKNFTEEGYLQCRDAFKKLAKVAEDAGAILSIEAYWRNCIDSIERAERLFRDVKSPGLGLVMDPCNYFRKEDLPKMRPMLEEMLKRLGNHIVVAHAKDVKAAAEGTDLPAAGRGVLDYPLYLQLLAQLGRPVDLIVEHLTLDDVPRARDYVLSQLEKI